MLGVMVMSGCVGGVSPSDGGGGEKVWQVAVTGYETTDWIDSSVPGYGFRAEAGYTWLKVHVTVKNLSKSQKSFDWLMSSFKFVSADENEYSQMLQLNEPPGYLPTVYHPGQTRSGWIAFEIPKGLDVSAGVILARINHDIFQGTREEFVFDLSDL